MPSNIVSSRKLTPEEIEALGLEFDPAVLDAGEEAAAEEAKKMVAREPQAKPGFAKRHAEGARQKIESVKAESQPKTAAAKADWKPGPPVRTDSQVREPDPITLRIPPPKNPEDMSIEEILAALEDSGEADTKGAAAGVTPPLKSKAAPPPAPPEDDDQLINAQAKAAGTRRMAAFGEAGADMAGAISGTKQDNSFFRKVSADADKGEADILAARGDARTKRAGVRADEAHDLSQRRGELDIDSKTADNDRKRRWNDPNSQESQAARAIVKENLGQDIPNLTAQALEEFDPFLGKMIQERIAKAHDTNAMEIEKLRQSGLDGRAEEKNNTDIQKALLAQKDRNEWADINRAFVDARNRELNFKIMQVQDAELEPKPGTMPNVTALNRLRKMQGGLQHMTSVIAQMREIYRRKGAEKFFGQDYARYNGMYREALKTMQQVDENGVLSGPEWEILNQQLMDPTSFRAAMDRGAFDASARTAVASASDRFWQHVDANDLMPRKNPIASLDLAPVVYGGGEVSSRGSTSTPSDKVVKWQNIRTKEFQDASASDIAQADDREDWKFVGGN